MAKAKVKTEDTEEKKEPPVEERIQKEIQTKFGDNIMISGNDIVEKKKYVIPISPRLDSITGGGIPEGSWVIFAGKWKSGKTTTALHFGVNAQRPEHGNRTVYFLNVEARIKRRDILGIAHLQQDKFKIIQSTKDKVLSAKDFLNIASNILKTEENCVMIIDSLSALCDERELNDGIGTQLRGSDKILVRQFMSSMQSVVPNRNHIVISILQVMSNTSGYGSNTFERGGAAVQFQSDVKLRVDKFELWAGKEKENDKDKEAEPTVAVGQKVSWVCAWSALGSPGRKTESYIRYGLGIDEPYELIEEAKDVGLVVKAGAWLRCEFMKNHLDVLGVPSWDEKTLKENNIKVQWQGGDKFRNALVYDHPDWLEILKQDLKEML